MSKCESIAQSLKLTGIRRVNFIKSEWENLEGKDKVSIPYLLYRGLFLLYFLVVLPHSIYSSRSRSHWIILATHWSILAQTVYATLFFMNLLLRFITEKREARALKRRPNDSIKLFDANDAPKKRLPTKLNTVDSIVWLLLSKAGTIPYIVTLGYWIFVYNPNETKLNIAWDLTEHGFNAVLALVDILVIAIPVRKTHALYTVFFALAYVLFSCIYEYGGGSYWTEEKPYIYSFLNWRESPGWAIGSCAVAGVAAFVLHMCLWLLYKVRLFLVSMCRSNCGCCSIQV